MRKRNEKLMRNRIHKLRLDKRFLGSNVAWTFGFLYWLDSVTHILAGDQESGAGDFWAGVVMLSGATAYRSRKERLLNRRPTNVAQVLIWEVLGIALIAMATVFQRDLRVVFVSHGPIPFYILPCLAIIAYCCAGMFIRFEHKPTN